MNIVDKDLGTEGQEHFVQLTLFKDQWARAKRSWFTSLDTLADRIRTTRAPTKDRLPLLKLASFGEVPTKKGSLRHNENLIECYGCEGDYDGEVLRFDQAIEIARNAGLLCLIYTSPSWSPAKPRWRVLAPASDAVEPCDRSALVDRLDRVFGGVFGAESWVLSQSFFYGAPGSNPAPLVEIIDGRCIDQIDVVTDDNVDIGEFEGAGLRNIDPRELICGKSPEFWRSIAEGRGYGEGRHPAIVSLAGLLFGDPMIEPHLAAALIHAYNKELIHPPHDEDHVDAIIRWVAARENGRD